MALTLGDIIAILALGLSAFAVWTTSHFNRRQLLLIESQERLNKQLLRQGELDALDATKADVGASLIRIGSGKYKVKVYNRGKAEAKNVRIEFPEGNDLVSDSDIAAKFPMEVLVPHQSVELIASTYIGAKSKQKTVLRWSDDHSHDRSNTVYLTT